MTQRASATGQAVIACVLMLSAVITTGQSGLSADSVMVQGMLKPEVYDKGERPGAGGAPLNVSVDVVIESLGPVDSSSMEITMNILLRQEWTDPRLSFTRQDNLTDRQTDRFIALGSSYLPALWVPDLRFHGDVRSRMHKVTTPNVMIRLRPGGGVLYSQLITTTLKCMMDLHKFPHDAQHCMLVIKSFAYTLDDLVLHWSSRRSHAVAPPMEYMTEEFTLTSLDTTECTEHGGTGESSCLKVDILLKRDSGYYIIQTYVPSAIIVGLSWAGFWVDHRSPPARISVGLLTVLNIMAHRSSVVTSLFKVSYVKAVDVWMFVNLLFVFAAYLEFALVTVASRRYRTRRNKEEADSKMPDHAEANSKLPEGHAETYRKLPDHAEKRHVDILGVSNSYKIRGLGNPSQRSTERIHEPKKQETDPGGRLDVHSRWVFPLAYIVFVVLYLIFYVFI